MNSPVEPRRRPELLAPAGDWNCVRAAIENGADAVYFGLDCGFNARARAANFPLEDLPQLMQLLHRRGLAGYATLNVLVFSDELEEFQKVASACESAGVDAVLVQDVGAARLLRSTCPSLPLHASTQMTLTSSETIALAEQLGMQRVVVARELSLKEIKAIREHTSMPLEVFVHGALCVAYSGQCLTSESLGGRSANRGQCAQACRLPYEVVSDDQEVDLGLQKYLLSPQDLAAYALVPDLIDAGVASLKIEGRLKTPEYVANITRHYRRAIDEAMAGAASSISPADVEDMELSFSRGFSPGWLAGIDHKRLVPAMNSAKRGVRLGTIVDISRDRVVVELATGLVNGVKRGDGVAFACGVTSDESIGGRVYEVFHHGRSEAGAVTHGRVELAFGHGALDLARLAPGQSCWKTDDPQLTSRLRKTFQSDMPLRQQPIDLHVTAAVGKPLELVATTEAGATCRLASVELAAEAIKHPLDVELLRQQFGRLGGTPFQLREVSATIAGRPMLPLSVLGTLRKQLVASLDQAASTHTQRSAERPSSTPIGEPPPSSSTAGLPQLRVLARSLEQLHTLLAMGETNLAADFSDIREYREAVAVSRDAGARLLIATPRIHKPGEAGIFRLMAKADPDGILVRNVAALNFFRDAPRSLVGDFSLNITNEKSAAFFMASGLERVTASYDCNREQLLALVAATPPEWLEIVIHQHMPMFHMEHCVFCAVLSPGTDKTNCGRPCDEHRVHLRDRLGVAHRLTADVGCRNTLFNATPQSGAEVVPALLSRGMRHFRIELLDESADEIRNVVKAYRELLAGRVSGRDVWQQLKAANRVGVTRGTLEETRNPLAIL